MDEKLKEAYEEYIQLLDDEIKDLLGLAELHGWKSSRVEQGEKAREKIKQALKED